MTKDIIENIADQLNVARMNCAPVEQFSGTYKNLTRLDAYKVQELGISYREKLGEKVVGLKMGLTSEAKRKQMDLDSPLYGVLTDKMRVDDGGNYSLTGQIHPKIEPEIAFSIARELTSENTYEEILSSIDGVYIALEILDSRYKQFKYFSMEDVISDNSSSSHYILGEKVINFDKANLKKLNMKMRVDGAIAQEGSSSAISGDPVLSVVELCKLLSKRGKTLPANSLVLTGAATPAVALKQGMEIKLEVDGFSTIAVNITH